MCGVGSAQEEPVTLTGKEIVERLTRLEEGLKRVEAQLMQRLDAVEARLGQRLDGVEARINEAALKQLSQDNPKLAEILRQLDLL